jgi:hypothetical protein
MSETAVDACNESLKVESQDLDGDGLITTTEIEAQRYNEICQTELIQKVVATGFEGTVGNNQTTDDEGKDTNDEPKAKAKGENTRYFR